MEKMYGQTGADTEKLCLKNGKTLDCSGEWLQHNVSYVVYLAFGKDSYFFTDFLKDFAKKIQEIRSSSASTFEKLS